MPADLQSSRGTALCYLGAGGGLVSGLQSYLLAGQGRSSPGGSSLPTDSPPSHPATEEELEEDYYGSTVHPGIYQQIYGHPGNPYSEYGSPSSPIRPRSAQRDYLGEYPRRLTVDYMCTDLQYQLFLKLCKNKAKDSRIRWSQDGDITSSCLYTYFSMITTSSNGRNCVWENFILCLL